MSVVDTTANATASAKAARRRAALRAGGDDGGHRSTFGVVRAEDADGGLRLSLFGDIDGECTSLRDVVIAALQSEPPRLEVELAGVGTIDEEGASFLLACGRMARLVGVEYRLTRAGGAVAAALTASARRRGTTAASA